ncbi:MAG TPA: hypothetical protein VEY93_11420, partial [Longimicrobium sp.]|nr:hypothetical protein [Longimicrobium sp.]
MGYPTPDEPVPVDMRCLVAFRGGVPVARLSYGTAWDIRGVAGPCMLIGHYERTDRWAGAWLLDEVLARTPDGHLFHALGPINGSTWGRYRLALPPRLEEEGDPEPPFLSEPWNPPDYPADFEERGFDVVARYESAIVEDLAAADPRRDELAERVRARGATIRPLDLGRFDDELRAIFELSRTAFAENLFYSPIEFDEFRARYLPLRPLLDPEMVRLAE